MNTIINIIKGVLIGLANIIPGVSGGTIAVTMGVYDIIISAINDIKKNFLKSVKILMPFVIGAVLGIGALSFVVKYTLDKYPLQTSSLFIGFIIGGVPLLIKKTKGKESKIIKIILFLIFFALVVIISFMGGNGKTTTDITINSLSIIQLLLIGIVASAAMVIPGISGSLLMMTLGFYGIIISNISNFIRAIIKLDLSLVSHSFLVLLPFGFGILIGIGLIAKLIAALFKKIPQLTYAAILGLVSASPIPIMNKMVSVNFDAMSIIVAIITFAIGFVIAFKLGEE